MSRNCPQLSLPFSTCLCVDNGAILSTQAQGGSGNLAGFYGTYSQVNVPRVAAMQYKFKRVYSAVGPIALIKR